ncbi:MAG: enoyl-CoA hydratase-related protein [Proteobacteria bacterium]|nr:enoyl-CoA hydratase-related protein [Cystobacterineae bacterium]MCL2259659.1 enoyl-CoA hydratase-related protein [Cystobacterineae bacterium]MCL2313799.1 enoyl-CoA hydratase-related protein [Pseudomonadota bacterium]
MTQSQLLREDLGEGVCRLTLLNARQRNALTAALLGELVETFSSFPEVRAWLLRGEGERAFSAGYNLESLRHYEVQEPLPDELVNEALCAIEAHPAPSVALIHGFAYGAGLELAAACDFRISDTSGLFCMPPARLGLAYPLWGIRRLADLVGMGRARWMFLTGEEVEAAEALEWGLINGLEESVEGAREQAEGLCRKLAAGAPLAIGGMRESMRAYSTGRQTDVLTQERLRESRRLAYNSEDTREGRAAFLEKRAPRFRGC